jgi:hypothetical protein
MSPQRELGGAQSLASKPKRFNAFGYFRILLSETAFCLLTHQLALGAQCAHEGVMSVGCKSLPWESYGPMKLKVTASPRGGVESNRRQTVGP